MENENEKEIILSSLLSKSFYSEDEQAEEDLLIHLFKIFNEHCKFEEPFHFDKLARSDFLRQFIYTFEPNFKEEKTDSPNLTEKDKIINLIKSLDNRFGVLKKNNEYRFLTDISIEKVVNIDQLLEGYKNEVEKFFKLLLVFVATSQNFKEALDKLSDLDDKYLDLFLTIIQNYIELSDEKTADKLDPKQKRFTKHSSQTSFSNPTVLFNSIDKLRKKNDELEEQLAKFSKIISSFDEEREIYKNEISSLKEKLNKNSFIITKEISDNKAKEIDLNLKLNQKTKELDELVIKNKTEISQLKQKCQDLEKELFDAKILCNSAQDLKEENSHLKKDFEMFKEKSQNQIESLTKMNTNLRENNLYLEKERNNVENKIMSLRNDLKIEQTKNTSLNKTVLVLQNVFKENEEKVKKENGENPENPKNEYEIQIEHLISDIQKKNIQICSLSQELTDTKDKLDSRQEKSIQLVSDFFIPAVQLDFQTKILFYKEELRKKDRDIAFLKNAFNDLRLKSEEEYNTVSSSLYELAFHLTKIKKEFNTESP